MKLIPFQLVYFLCINKIMGGYGSGEHFRNANYRYPVEDCLSIKIRQLQIRNLINEPDSETYFTITFYDQI